MHDGTLPTGATSRFSRKRDAIIAAATEILNHRGVKGMTLAGVAQRVGLITTSVTYYFKKKEDLAAACFMAGLERLDALANQALRETTPEARLHRLLDLYLEDCRRQVAQETPPIPVFSDIRALSEPWHKTVGEAYGAFFRRVRSIFRSPGLEWLDSRAATARTQILIEQLHWSVAWLPRYDTEDYPRIRDRMFDILVNGLAIPGSEFRPQGLDISTPVPAFGESARETFLLAATRLINAFGYRGASVEKISAELNVTKGSFYHHHDAKDDLVFDCFERYCEVSRRAQTAARQLTGSEWEKLVSATVALVEYQLSDQGPLLRTSALMAVPETMRGEMVEQAARVSDRFASMISDGIAEGSIRPIDPAIASQMVGATINAAADLESLMQGHVRRDEVADLYARPMMVGLFSR